MSELASISRNVAPVESTIANALPGKAAANSAAPSPRLVHAAHEFEAAMMKELLAPLTSNHDLLGGGEDDPGSGSALSAFAGEALGKALSERGGFGLASSILRQLSPGSNRSGTPSVPGKSGQNFARSPRK